MLNNYDLLGKTVSKQECKREKALSSRCTIRKISAQFGVCGNADGSLLFQMGNTRVIVTVKLEPGIPGFLRLKKTGWLTAEYRLLPGSTHVRTVRESKSSRYNGRSTEISRFIGRSFRSVTRLQLIPDKTIYIDCDVVQADGGTRSASICAAYCALKIAEKRWLRDGIITESILKDEIAAVSVGIVRDMVSLDLNAAEDREAHADFNFVLTRSGRVVEIQGTGESAPLTWQAFDEMRHVAVRGVETIFATYDQML